MAPGGKGAPDGRGRGPHVTCGFKKSIWRHLLSSTELDKYDDLYIHVIILLNINQY